MKFFLYCGIISKGVTMKTEIIIKSREEMIKLGQKIGKMAQPNMVLALEGDLGAGKTTLTKGIALGLGITEIINSPTFTIMKIHEGGRLTLYHMDVYRLSNDSGDQDLEEYLYQDGVAVVEWASNFSDLLPEEYMLVTITDLGDNQRKVEIESEISRYVEIIRSL